MGAVHGLRRGDLAVEIAVDDPAMRARFGPRFDRSAHVRQIEFAGRAYLDPAGLCDEFGLLGDGVLGYAGAAPGEPFLKLGVGRLRRISAAPYAFATPYPLEQDAALVASAGPDRVETEAADTLGPAFGYRLRKRYTLPGAATLELACTLTNTGTQPFSFEHYNHHWFRLGGRSVGTACRFSGSLAPPAAEPPPPGWARTGAAVHLDGPAPAEGGAAWRWSVPQTTGPATARLRSEPDGPQVDFAPDYRPDRAALWCVAAAFCPEFFLRRTLAPGASTAWSMRYTLG